MTHIMIDLETMGTRPNAPIVAIGAVGFTKTEVRVDTAFEVNIDLEDAIRQGGVPSKSTQVWWAQQSQEAQDAWKTNPHTVVDALAKFEQWLWTQGRLEGIWGCGSDFDNVLLSETHVRIGRKLPWRFYMNRCYRTMKALNPDVVMDRKGTYHRSVDDAISQAQHLVRMNVL